MRKSAALFLLPLLGSSFRAPVLAQTPEIKAYTGTGWFSGVKRKYLPRYEPPVDFSNSPRLDSLMRAGRIYLSLRDAIALALENNLDIEFARFGPRLAESDELRASAGQLLRNVQSSARQGPSSATSGVLAGASALGNTAQNQGQGGGQSGVLSGVTVQLTGATIPNLDPIAYVVGQWGHQTQPLATSFVAGNNFLTSDRTVAGFGIQKGFLTGTTVNLEMNNNLLRQNSPNNDFNPSTSANAQITISQQLLQGFGLAVNSRAIRIAKNNRNVSDLAFKDQVIVSVSNIVSLYWDLVTLNENLKVKRQALALNQKLYEDNKKRAELGAIAPIDIVQAEAEVAASQQEVTNAETQVLQQEMILKSVLTRTGVDSLSIADARIVPGDRIQVPDKEAIRPIQDLVAEALENRPDIAQSQIQLENSRISIQGTKSALLPSLEVFATLRNNALAGQVNTIPLPQSPGQPLIPRDPRGVDQFFLGGYGTVLGRLLARNFPDYSIGFQLNVPLRNRAAQADLIKDQLNLRQQQINDRQLQNNVRLSVLNARIATEQARAAYDTAVKARLLQEQTLNGERRRYQLGTSSFLNVVIVQRDLATRQSAEVSALSAYISAKTNLDRVTGKILERHEVSLEEAYTGVVKRAPDMLPVFDQNGSN